VGQLGESAVSSDGKVEEWIVDIRASKVVVPSLLKTVHSGNLRKYLNCTDRILALWGLVNRCILIIVVVG
jgi:hypothetical protein